MRFHKNLYEQIQYETAHGVAVEDRPEEKSLLPLVIWCVVPGVLLLLFAALRSHQGVMDRVVFGFTTPLKHALARLNDHVPFAVGELIWGLAILGLLVFLMHTVFLLIQGPERLRILLRRVLALAGTGLVVACCYTLMWGCNYYATSFAQRAGLSQRGMTSAELAQMTAAFAQKCNELAPQQERTGDGNVDYDVSGLFSGSAELYEGITAEFPALAVERHDPKPMFFSRLMSLTGFSGFYFPMTAESIVNVDQAQCMIPSTILHELAHQCNVAEEDAANFVAIIAGLRCDNPRFQYSSALLGYIHLSNALAGADRDYYAQVSALLSDQVRLDLEVNDSYWKRYDTPVADASEKVYTGFLESYGHDEGMKSYGMCVNLLSGYYLGENGRWSQATADAESTDPNNTASDEATASAAAEQAPETSARSAEAEQAQKTSADSSAAEQEAAAQSGQQEQSEQSKQESSGANSDSGSKKGKNSGDSQKKSSQKSKKSKNKKSSRKGKKSAKKKK